MKHPWYSNLTRTSLVALLLLSLLALALGQGCGLPLLPPASPGNKDTGLRAIEEAWNTLSREHVDKGKLDTSKLSRAAIEGMLQALDDPYASYLDAQDYKLELSHFQGKFDGIGAQVSIQAGLIIVTAPLPGSPAEKAGIKPGDGVLEINGQPTKGMGLAEAVLKIRGEKGTSVQLLIQHQGQEKPELMAIVRQAIDLPSVTFEKRGDIAYINIHYFSDRTPDELEAVTKGLPESEARGIVLDLRDNPGGLVQSVVKSASYFLKEGVVLYTLDNEGRRTSLERMAVPYTTDLPMVVLISHYSASGAEIIAGAVQDKGRGLLMGAKSFGKGSVDTFRMLAGGSAIYFTIGRWLTPNGNLIEGKGITPDVELDLVGESLVERAIDYLHSRAASLRESVPVATAVEEGTSPLLQDSRGPGTKAPPAKTFTRGGLKWQLLPK